MRTEAVVGDLEPYWSLKLTHIESPDRYRRVTVAQNSPRIVAVIIIVIDIFYQFVACVKKHVLCNNPVPIYLQINRPHRLPKMYLWQIHQYSIVIIKIPLWYIRVTKKKDSVAEYIPDQMQSSVIATSRDDDDDDDDNKSPTINHQPSAPASLAFLIHSTTTNGQPVIPALGYFLPIEFAPQNSGNYDFHPTAHYRA